MKKAVWCVVVLCALLANASAQAPGPAPYSEIEALRIQVVNLEGAIVQRAVSDWQAKVKALKADLEKARPGFEWNPETGQWAAVKPPAGGDGK